MAVYSLDVYCICVVPTPTPSWTLTLNNSGGTGKLGCRPFEDRHIQGGTHREGRRWGKRLTCGGDAPMAEDVHGMEEANKDGTHIWRRKHIGTNMRIERRTHIGRGDSQTRSKAETFLFLQINCFILSIHKKGR